MDASKVSSAVELMAFQSDMLLRHNLDIAKRSFWIIGEINQKTLKSFDACLSILEHQSNKQVTVRLCSEGGDADAALAIVSRMRSSKCNVNIEAHANVASAATLILACGHRRSISKYASFMFHEASYTAEGRHTQVKAWVDQFEKHEKVWCSLMAEHTNMTEPEWMELGKHTDKFMTPMELLEAGVVDKVF